jgi:hypothetical protein
VDATPGMTFGISSRSRQDWHRKNTNLLVRITATTDLALPQWGHAGVSRRLALRRSTSITGAADGWDIFVTSVHRIAHACVVRVKHRIRPG